MTTILDEKDMNAVISTDGAFACVCYLFAKAVADTAREQGLDYTSSLHMILPNAHWLCENAFGFRKNT